MLICVGVITGVKGVTGLLRVKCFTQNPGDLTAYGPLLGRDGVKTFHMSVQEVAETSVVVACKDVKDRTQAEGLKGTELFLPRAALPVLAEEEFYHVDLIGLDVQDEDGETLGTVSSVQNFGAGDFLEVRVPSRANQTSVTIPFTKEAVPLVDLKAGYLLARSSFILEASDKPERSRKREET